MPLPAVGEVVPDFTLPDYTHSTQFHLAEAMKEAPTLLTFFKRSCAVSRMTLPFVERLHRQYPAVQVVGISQDDQDDAAFIVDQSALSFPVLLDTNWQVSIAYDLVTVPTIFLLDTNGAVKCLNYGWQKANMEALAADVAQSAGAEPVPLFTDSDKVPVFKPG
jgi:peroxiredoxin